MKSLYSGGLCAASIVALSMVGFAQTTAQSPQTTGSQGTSASAGQQGADQTVTVTGCVQREADYRRAQDAGRGGVAGTGIGAGNEFVLANASMGAGPAAAATGATATGTATAGTTTGTATGTAGAAATGTAYELTGSNEAQAAKHVGQRVEISGRLKAAEAGAAGRPTGGPTAGKPPAGVDVVSQDLQLRELEVTSIRPVAGTCPQ